MVSLWKKSKFMFDNYYYCSNCFNYIHKDYKLNSIPIERVYPECPYCKSKMKGDCDERY